MRHSVSVSFHFVQEFICVSSPCLRWSLALCLKLGASSCEYSEPAVNPPTIFKLHFKLLAVEMKFVPRCVNPEITKHTLSDENLTLSHCFTIYFRLYASIDIGLLKGYVALSFA